MDEDELKQWALIALVLLVGFGIVPVVVFEWFFKNVFTPIGTIEQIASVFSSSNPWMWVLGLMGILVSGLVFKALWEWAKDQISL
jgi:divalent metal cation (Fe/Co/Zn/Cd) transporter